MPYNPKLREKYRVLMRARRATARSLGLCIVCTARPARDPYVHCFLCRYRRKRDRKLATLKKGLPPLL